MMLYCVLIGLVLASSYCRAYVVVEQASLEQRVETLEYELEHGGKQYQTVPYNSKSLYFTMKLAGGLSWSHVTMKIA